MRRSVAIVVTGLLLQQQWATGVVFAGHPESGEEVVAVEARVHQLNTTHANCYSVATPEEEFTACLPEIIVGGHAKCGTSALYSLLESHPEVVGTPDKEHCYRHDDAVRFLKHLPPLPTTHKRVSGCITFEHNDIMLRALRPKRPIKIIFVVRDYADTLWAAFNFWCIKHFDPDCHPGTDWTDSTTGYRSPELFHEFVMAERVTGVVRNALESPYTTPLVFTDKIRAYERIVGKGNVLVLDADALTSSTRSTWLEIAKFAGLSPHHPSLPLFRARRYNAQDRFEHRGASSYKASANHVTGLYAASGHRPMLDHTRRMIHAAWHRDCTLLNEAYNLSLGACV